MKFQAFNLLKPYSPGTLPQTCYRENSKLHLPKVQPNVIIFCRIRPDPTSGSCVLTLAVSNSWLFAIPWTIARQAPLVPGKNTGVGCHSLFQGIFPTQGSNLVFCIGRWILWHLSHQGSPVTGFKQQVCVCIAKLFQSCLTLCNPMDDHPPGSSVHGILQARILKWVAMPQIPANSTSSHFFF